MKTEKELAAELGVDRKMLAGWRKDGTIEGDSWVKVSNQITYDEAGEHAVRNILQKEICADSLSDPLPANSEPESLTVTQIPINPKMVICGDTRVRVSNNRNFIKGMKVTARPPATGERVWVMVGRCPRWRGKY